jgi:hypothetical protein
MKTMSVIAQEQKVIKHFAKSLMKRQFKNVLVNYHKGEIIAERRNLFFGRKYSLRLTVKQIDDTVTNIELIVNPHHNIPSFIDAEIEQQLESQLVTYL